MAVYPEYPRGKRIYPEPVVNIAYSIAATVDNALDNLIGIRPVGHAMEIADLLAPANVIRTITGVPKPSEIVEEILDRLNEEVVYTLRRTRRFGGRLRRIL